MKVFAFQRFSRRGFVALLMLSAFGITGGRTAFADDWQPGVFMTQAVTRVMGAAQAAGDAASYGWAPNTCLLAAYLDPHESCAMTFNFNEGERYMFIAGGDEFARDVDLEILDEDDHVVAKDTDTDPTAVVRFTPRHSGKYTLKLILYSAKRASFCAVAVLKHDGYNVPVGNLADATAHLIVTCNIIDKKIKEKLIFHGAHNQWAMFGTILQEGEGTTITHLHPGQGILAYVSGADNIANDIDLSLLDDDGNVLKDDRGSQPALVYQMRNRDYGLQTRVKDSKRGGATLVLTAVLEIR